MRRIYLFTVMAVAMIVGLTSCDKETANLKQTGEAAVINLFIEGSATRAAGDPGDLADSKINTLGVFVFTGNTNNDACINKFNVAIPLTGSKTGDLLTSDNAKYVFVVANAGDITSNALKSVVNVGDLKAALADLGSTTAEAQSATNVMMTSADLAQLTLFTGTPKKATVTATLSFVGAKTIIKWDEGTDFLNASNNWTFDLFVNQANAKAKFFGTDAERSVVSAAGYYSAIATTINPASATNVVKSYLTDVDVAKQTDCHYYLFGNNAALKTTIIGVVARHASKSARYFTVHFNGVDAKGNTIVPGNVYVITIKLKGDLDNPVTPPGTPDPETEVNPADIDVTITPAAWETRIMIDKEV